MAFLLPIIKNFFSCSTNCATYSRKSEKGGFVTTISASLSSSMQSLLLKSPALFLSLSSSSRRIPGWCSLGSEFKFSLKCSKSLYLLASKAFSVFCDCFFLQERERERELLLHRKVSAFADL